MEISTSLVGLERTISRLYTEFHYSSHVRSSKEGISKIFPYIRVSKQRNCIRKWQKYELNMSDDGHFEFCDLWENGVIYSLSYGRNWFSTKFSYRNNKLSTFPKKCLQVFIQSYISMFCPDNKGDNHNLNVNSHIFNLRKKKFICREMWISLKCLT